jgi:uncharacterized protein
VTNVAAFGAFVDVGVHQDGLVHISAMSDKFVSNPHDVVKSGQVVKVKVLEADPERKRISLTLRLDDEVPTGEPRRQGSGQAGRPGDVRKEGSRPGSGGGRPGSGGGRHGRRDGKKPSGNDRQPGTGASADTAMAEALRRAGLGR